MKASLQRPYGNEILDTDHMCAFREADWNDSGTVKRNRKT